ncbi:tight adherence protein C [Humibacillus xanthopallidus]|uniref:Tight adherence protein C n=1 Tax=Humibacillus xanthopallidus TaxID=412689 RepID=A0A543PMF5_9MICO|nr:type II secretion system F family protein [Humibacillus xanthopallidus]TQN45246.1 tight adherence protein C [Humibacillus xanthopallidus]
MNVIYVAAMLIALGLLAAVLLLFASSSGPTGVAKSLSLIDESVGDRSVVRTELPASDRLVAPILNRTRRLAFALSPRDVGERLARGLDRAGNPSPWTVERVMGTKGAALLIGLLLGIVFGGLSLKGLFYAAVLGTAFFFLPDLLLYNAALRRQEETAKGLAEALDMLTVCVEAGQGFDAALVQVSRNIDGPIAGEFARVLSEIQIGKSRGEAFAALGDRIATPEVRNFTSALVQADRLGLPIGAVLREQTAAFRLERKQKAEERAQKVTIKILFPMLLCIFPALIIVIIGPGVIRMVEAFSGGNL